MAFKREDKDIEEAIMLLRGKYRWAKTQEWISDPLGWSLYRVWKMHTNMREKKNERGKKQR